ncbi:MAG: hypothetical protein LBE27_06035 [Deltaproteobacteria bacterium]|nr:hypothetical protein [Deltaproteobacteria bacterium]
METTEKKSRKRFWMGLIIVVLVLIVATVLFLPSLILTLWVNQSFDSDQNSVFSRISAERARVSPLLKGFSIKGFKAYPRANPDNPVTIATIEGKGLKASTVLKLLIGQSEAAYPELLEGGRVSLSELQNGGSVPGIERLEATEISLAGLAYDPEKTLKDLSLEEFHISKLELSLDSQESLELPELKVSGLKSGILEAAQVEGMLFSYRGMASLNFQSLRVKNFDQATFSRRSKGGDFVAKLLSFFINTQEITLKKLEGTVFQEEGLKLGELSWTHVASDPKTPKDHLEISQALFKPQGLIPFLGGEPVWLPIVEGLSSPMEFDLSFLTDRKGPALEIKLKVDSKENFRLEMLQNFKMAAFLNKTLPGMAAELLHDALWMNGNIQYDDLGFASRLDQATVKTSGSTLPKLLEETFQNQDSLEGLDYVQLVNKLEEFLRDPKSLSLVIKASRDLPIIPLVSIAPMSPFAPVVPLTPDLRTQGNLLSGIRKLLPELSVNGEPPIILFPESPTSTASPATPLSPTTPASYDEP